MANTASTQIELERNQLHAHYLERAKELMQDAAKDGVVINLNMHTYKHGQSFASTDFIMVSPFAHGEGKVMLYPEPDTTGQKFTG